MFSRVTARRSESPLLTFRHLYNGSACSSVNKQFASSRSLFAQTGIELCAVVEAMFSLEQSMAISAQKNALQLQSRGAHDPFR